MAPHRQTIHLSPDCCGGRGLTALFLANGLEVPSHDRALARDILYYRAAGLPAPESWRRYALLTELHHHDGYARPPALGYAALDWLDANFPGALFLLTTRDPEGWIADRLGATSLRRDARATAHHLGCAPASLPDRWLAEWDAHLAAVRARFAGRADYLELDLDGVDFAALRDWLSPHVPGLTKLPKGALVLDQAEGMRLDRVAALLDDTALPVARQGGAVDNALLDVLVPHCIGRMQRDGQGPRHPARVSKIYGWWDGGARVLDRDGRPAPLAFDPGPPPGFAAKWDGHKSLRLEQALTQLYRAGRRAPVQVDMQDARRIGTGPGTEIAQPLVAYNRREGAVNVALWPLAGFHDIGSPNFARPHCPDTIPFQDKRDVAIWRGRLAGAARRADGTGVPADQVLARLSRGDLSRAGRAEAIAELYSIPRLQIVRRHAGRTGMDFRLRLSWGLRDCADLPELRRYLGPPLSHAEMLQCRYQICLSGHDVGTSFVWQANSQAVVLKEEAGWEVYYSALFRPWEHYIPLAPLAGDLDEKLDWARAHPARCLEIAAAARDAAQRLAHKPTQDALMRAVAEAIPPIDPPT